MSICYSHPKVYQEQLMTYTFIFVFIKCVFIIDTMSCNETSDILSMFSAKGIRVKACVSYVINIFDKVISYLLLLELQITVKSTSIRNSNSKP